MTAAAPSRRPLPRATLSVQIAERVREDILSGAYQPGAQLSEAELALSFGVSRGPLREAMQRLIQEGLLRSEPHHGVFVPDLTEDDLADVFFVRATIEAAAIRRIVTRSARGTVSRDLSGIADQMDRAMKAGDWSVGGELDFAFHRTLVDAAGSDRLSRTYATVQAETRLCLHRLMGGYRRSEDLADEHHRLARLVGTAPLDEVLAELERHFGDPAETLRKMRAARAAGTNANPSWADMTDTITLPPVSMADLDPILDLVAAVRWPHRRADVSPLIELGFGRVARDEADGRTVAAGLWWPFGEASARLGLVIVAPDSQGRGVGRRLVEALLADAAPRSVMLLATTAGRPLYDALGFVQVGANTQYQGVYRGTPVRDPRVRPATAADRSALHALDSSALGSERPDVLDHLLAVGRTIVLADGDTLTGYAVEREYGRGLSIGPIVAGSEADAVALFQSLARPGFVRVDCASEASLLSGHLIQAGLESVGESPVMLRGTWSPPAGPARIFGLASHALG